METDFQTALKQVLELKEAKTSADALKYLIVVGIGGSNLGARAVYEALRGPESYWTSNSRPRVIFIDNLDEQLAADFSAFATANFTTLSDFLLVVISESGQTLETKLNFSLLWEIISRQFPNAATRVAAVTKPGTPLAEEAEEKGFTSLFVPTSTVGRYSIFSVVGLLPLALADIEVTALVAGAEKGTQTSTTESATLIHQHYSLGIKIYDLFLFDGRLASFGAWWRQLFAESLGKDGCQLLPTVSLGERDLHSVLQAYLGSGASRLTHFLSVQSAASVGTENKIGIAKQAILEAVKKAYQERNLPFHETVLPIISAKNLGRLMQIRMQETVELAKLLGVDPFNQPAVESYKRHVVSL